MSWTGTCGSGSLRRVQLPDLDVFLQDVWVRLSGENVRQELNLVLPGGRSVSLVTAIGTNGARGV
jgi:hypothetical protein